MPVTTGRASSWASRMPTWKSPESAASLPSSTRSYDVPAASWSRTTAAISRATSAGPSVTGSASTSTAAVQPTPSAERSCSTDVRGTDRAARSPSLGRRGDLHGQLDGAAVVVAQRVAHEAGVRGLRVLGEQHLAGEVRHPLDADEHVTRHVEASPDPLVARVEQRGRVHGADRHRVELLHVGHRELVADPWPGPGGR